ncbi:MAG: 1-acyl-sn-glycerol-3-phosphate acyltransferase, partial [Pseudomonadota bacterium]
MQDISESSGWFRRWLTRFLQNTHDHFSCYLPASIGFFSTWLLRLLFSGIEVNQEDKDFLRSLGPDKIVVYATKYRSSFEFLYFHSRYKKEKLPYPLLGLDNRIWLWQPVSRVLRIVAAFLDHVIRFRKQPNPYESGYVEREILSGAVSLVSMVDRKAFYRRYVKAKSDPLVHLLQAQAKTDREILVIPQLVLYGTRPQKSRKTMMQNVFGTEEGPGRLRRLLSLIKLPEQALVESGKPISLKDFMQSREEKGASLQYLAYELRQEVTDRINSHRKSIVGPILISREELGQKVLQSESFRQYVKELALSSDRSVYEFQAEAASYLNEIAANYSSRTIDMLGMAVGWLTRTMFDGVEVDVKGLKRLKAFSQKGPVILMPCHKSHIDYLILSYILYLNHMPCPLIAAGKNLSFFPMGTIFRNSGAFFIRRSFKGLPLYTRVFSEYIRALLETGFNIEFFLEGGRSRTGKLVLPKFGLLSILLDAYAQGACNDLYFQPIFIGYDRVLEEGSYIREVEGGEKKDENFSQMVRARKFLKKRYGRIFVEFNEPIRAKDFLSQFQVPYDKMSTQEKGVVYRNLGHRIIHAIDQVTVVTPHSLVAAAALTVPGRSFSGDDIQTMVDFYLTHLKTNQAKFSDTLMDHPPAVRQTLE